MFLIFDSETSGFSESRLLQFGMLLVDASHVPIMEASILIRPESWLIEEGATKVHGITQDYATKHGLPQDVALMLFIEFTRRAEMLVCHNVEFDSRVMAGELSRAKWPRLNKSYFCTMEAMTPVCCLPASDKQRRAGFGGHKKPKLIEAYRHAFGEGFEGAHDAMADCRATARLFKWLKQPQSSVREDQFGQPVCIVPPTLSVLFPPPPPLPHVP